MKIVWRWIIDANVCQVLGKIKVCKVTFLSLKSFDKQTDVSFSNDDQLLVRPLAKSTFLLVVFFRFSNYAFKEDCKSGQ